MPSIAPPKTKFYYFYYAGPWGGVKMGSKDFDNITSCGYPTSTRDNSITSELIIYPQPATGKFTAEFPGTIVEGVLSLKDLTGRIVYLDVIDNKNWHTVPTDKLVLGLYLLEVFDQRKNTILPKKIVIN